VEEPGGKLAKAFQTIKEDVMKHQELILAILAMSMGSVVAPNESRANADEHHHHHSMEPVNMAVMRSVAAYSVPDVKLTDSGGKKVSLRDVLAGGKPVMLNFIYTSCTAVCPIMSATFSDVQTKLGVDRDKVRMVSISIDPEQDTPARLKAYARKFGAGPQWQMLTGSAEESLAVQRAFDTYRGDKMNHEPVTFLRNANGKSWVRIQGFASADQLLREYHQIVAMQ
jgi:protein SCO1/2